MFNLASTPGKIFRTYILSWDFIAPAVVSFAFYMANDTIAYDWIFSTLSVVSGAHATIFSILMGAMAFIASSASDDFINFIENNGRTYSGMLDSFRFSLIVMASGVFILYGFLFVLSIELYLLAINHIVTIVSVCVFIVFYGLCVLINSSLEIIHFAKARTKFVLNRHLVSPGTDPEPPKI